MEETFRLGRVAGIQIGVNWSLILIAWLLTWSMANSVLPDASPGHSTGLYWVAGALGTVLFYGSLLTHELSHALVARRRGVGIEGITLWLFGGVARLKSEPATPRDELAIAIAGPAASFTIAGFFGLIWLSVHSIQPDGATGSIIAGLFGWLATTNALLAVFNLVPAAPLDGGRVLRALLWGWRGDRIRATVVSSRAGRGFGFLLIGLGILSATSGAGLSGLWFVFLGWFLLNAARAEEHHVLLRGALAGVTVAQVMTNQPVALPSRLSVEDFVNQHLWRQHCSSFPITGANGEVQGLVTLTQLRAVEPERRSITSLGDIATPLAAIAVAKAEEFLVDVLERLPASDQQRILVLDQGHLTGIVSPSDISRAVSASALVSRRVGQTQPGN